MKSRRVLKEFLILIIFLFEYSQLCKNFNITIKNFTEKYYILLNYYILSVMQSQ